MQRSGGHRVANRSNRFATAIDRASGRFSLELCGFEALVRPYDADGVPIPAALFVGLLGVRLSIDDFGKGFSSLSRLQNLPVHALKVDQSFVEDIENEDGGALTRGMIIMAHSLKLEVTAEGVETRRQLAFVESNGCDRLQGYLFSPPLSPPEMLDYLKARYRTQRP